MACKQVSVLLHSLRSSRPIHIKKHAVPMPLHKTAEPFCGFGHKSLFSAKLRRFACKPELKGDNRAHGCVDMRSIGSALHKTAKPFLEPWEQSVLPLYVPGKVFWDCV